MLYRSLKTLKWSALYKVAHYAAILTEGVKKWLIETYQWLDNPRCIVGTSIFQEDAWTISLPPSNYIFRSLEWPSQGIHSRLLSYVKACLFDDWHSRVRCSLKVYLSKGFCKMLCDKSVIGSVSSFFDTPFSFALS